MQPVPNKEAASFLLDAASADVLRHRALALLQGFTRSFALGPIEAIVKALEAGAQIRDEGLLGELKEVNSAYAYVRARLLYGWGDKTNAVSELSLCSESLKRPEPWVLSLLARWRFALGEVTAAARDLRLALSLNPSYAWYLRSEPLVRKLLKSKDYTPRREVRIALLSTASTTLIAPVLQACLLRDGISATLHEAPFGALGQEILDPNSEMYRFAPDIVVLGLTHRDLGVGPSGGWNSAEGFSRQLKEFWRTIKANAPAHLIQLTVALPRGGAWGSLEDSLPQGRRRVIHRFNLLLSEDLPAGVSVLDVDAIPGVGEIASEEEWSNLKQLPKAESLPAFCTALAAQVRAVLGFSAKVLVTDLDNTLWGGIIGEDGIEGIRVGPPSAEGQGYWALQHHMQELTMRGIVLAVCSKNNKADALLPFQKHDGMLLKLEA